MNVTVTPMTREHIREVSLIENASFSDPWSEKSFEEELSNPHAVFLTALCEGRVCGYLGFHFVLDEGYIANVAVHPDYRHKGIGRALMQTAEEKARELFLSFLSLEVRVSNEAAQRLYASQGYENLGVRPNFYENPREDAFIMTKRFE